MSDYAVFGFDPPSTTNLGWASFIVEDGVATRDDSGVHQVVKDDDDVKERLLGIESFLLELIDRYPDVSVMCFERSIGGGWAPTREKLGEATGVMKLTCFHHDIDIDVIHTGSMAKQLTGSAASKGKKTRIKRLARELFYPDAPTYKSIASYTKETGQQVEYFEHEADAICFGMFHLLEKGVTVEGPGGSMEAFCD